MKTWKPTPGIHTGIPNDLYHEDRTAVSSTWLKLVDDKTPYHLRSYLDSPPAEPEHKVTALTMGSAVDCLIFEPEEFDKQFTVHPDLNLRTNAGKEEWQKLLSNWRETKRQPLRETKYEEALLSAKSIRTNPRMADYLAMDGLSQMIVVWEDPVTGQLCKCKTDRYIREDDGGTIIDLKTAVDASPIGFSKAVGNFSYHIQDAFYTDGYLAAGLPVSRFLFAVQEKPDGRNTFEASPNLLSWYELTSQEVERGRDSYISSLMAINFCQMNDEWEGYTNETQLIERPGYFRKGDVEDVQRL